MLYNRNLILKRRRAQCEADELQKLQRLLEAVLDKYGIMEEVFTGDGRHPRIILMRRVICAVLRNQYLLSYPLIAYTMGRPNHSSTMEMMGYWERVDKQQPIVGANFGTLEGKTYQQVYDSVAETMRDAEAQEVKA